jgi:hypothetical protein
MPLAQPHPDRAVFVAACHRQPTSRETDTRRPQRERERERESTVWLQCPMGRSESLSSCALLCPPVPPAALRAIPHRAPTGTATSGKESTQRRRRTPPTRRILEHVGNRGRAGHEIGQISMLLLVCVCVVSVVCWRARMWLCVGPLRPFGPFRCRCCCDCPALPFPLPAPRHARRAHTPHTEQTDPRNTRTFACRACCTFPLSHPPAAPPSLPPVRRCNGALAAPATDRGSAARTQHKHTTTANTITRSHACDDGVRSR